MALLTRRIIHGILILFALINVAQSDGLIKKPFRWVKKTFFKHKDPITFPAFTLWAKGLDRWTRAVEHGRWNGLVSPRRLIFRISHQIF